MSGITAMGTTFNLPNYTGQLFALTPSDTPLLSAIGGLSGGGMVSSTEFEWQTFDLRDPSQKVQVEGATAPTPEGRVRANVTNVVQVHQSKVSVSYTKQSTPGQLASPQSAPFNMPTPAGSGTVANELDWQVQRAIEQIALDVNWSFINGTFNKPTDNTAARKTRGLLQAISTNKVSLASSTVTGLTSATDTITETATGLADDDKIVFTKTGDTPLVAGRVYFVVSKSTNSFKVAKTKGGTAITLGTSTSNIDYLKPQTTALATTDIDALLQQTYDNGGLTGGNATILVNSSQKRAITKAYADAYGKSVLIPEVGNRSVGGVNVTAIETDFGVLNIMLDRHVPQDALLVLTMNQLRPVFLNVPGKGVFFTEELAKTGASTDEQIYGEIGLAYGNELAHAQLRGLAV